MKFNDNKDIDEENFEYIKTVVEAGYLAGYPDNTFKPKNNLTREQMAVILINIIGMDNKKNIEKVNYEDIKELSLWSYYQVMNAHKLGLMQGKGNNMFKPKDNLTKAEASKVISDLIKIMNNKRM